VANPEHSLGAQDRLEGQPDTGEDWNSKLRLITFSDNMITGSDHIKHMGQHLKENRILERLFSSRVRVQLLAIFLLHPDASFHVRELSRQVDASYSAIWKELANLDALGLLESEVSAQRKIYRINPDFPILPELQIIILKTIGAGDTIRQALQSLGEVNTAFIFGSFAEADSDSLSDLDLMVVGEVNLKDLSLSIEELENQLGRAVNYMTYTLQEWQEKVKNGDPFVHNVLEGDKIMLVGSEDVLRESAETGAN
jgi:predicted nucleotidyltransferase